MHHRRMGAVPSSHKAPISLMGLGRSKMQWLGTRLRLRVLKQKWAMDDQLGGLEIGEWLVGRDFCNGSTAA